MKNLNQIGIILVLVAVLVSIYLMVRFPITLGLDLQGGTRLVLQAQPTETIQVTEDAVKGVEAVIRNRIDALGVAEPIIQRKGGEQIIVELPGVKDEERAVRIVGDTALLEFVEAEWAPADENVLTPAKIAEVYGKGAYLDKVKFYQNGKLVDSRPIILKRSVLTGSDLKDSMPSVDQFGNPEVDLEFNAKGSSVFSSVTTRNVGKPIAILLDKKIISAPNVKEPIPSGRARISGNFTVDEVSDLVIKLKAGALPVPVKIVETRVVGPTLGKDSMDKSKIAGIIGFIIVMVFMASYYRVPGLVADAALILYVIFVFGILALLGTTLTLPGIAGFLLSIGMAVDANVIIFERFKEEIRSGKTLRMAIDASFSRAMTAIVDSNVTTLISAVILFWLGTGTIKGFAVTLTVGVICSMLTAITITHLFMNLMVDWKILKHTKTKAILH